MKKPRTPKNRLKALPKTLGPLIYVDPRYMVVTPLNRSIVEREIDQ